MNTTTATKAAALSDIDTLDVLSTPVTVQVQASKLRERMVLVDPTLGTPLFWIDHRMPAARNSGDAKFLVHNLETGRITTLSLGGRTLVPAMAR